jgi:cobalt-precorrin 5A hydrolase
VVFPRDAPTGQNICGALKEEYKPSLILYEKECLGQALKSYDAVVAVMAVGIVVRLLCRSLQNKWIDAPVVAVDSSLGCAVPVIGGHHGANDLALFLHRKLGLYPAITTATDASGRPCLEKIATAIGAKIANPDSSKAINLAFLKEEVPIVRLKGPRIVIVDSDVAILRGTGIVVGVGARKGVSAKEVLDAIFSALMLIGRNREEIRVLVTADLKRDEEGLIEAAKFLGKELICLPPDVLNSQDSTTPSRASDLGLLGVAEPAVLALSEKLIMPKKAFGRVTVALGE